MMPSSSVEVVEVSGLVEALVVARAGLELLLELLPGPLLHSGAAPAPASLVALASLVFRKL